jgi:hypothetical protein
MMYLALVVLLTATFDVVICDQVSACIPVIRCLSSARVLFYCHFPDMVRGSCWPAASRSALAPSSSIPAQRCSSVHGGPLPLSPLLLPSS